MSEGKMPARMRAEQRGAERPELAHELGLVVLMAMESVLGGELFAGELGGWSYSTSFPMPDGQHWRLSIEKTEEEADAR